jgi:hypothetical protein
MSRTFAPLVALAASCALGCSTSGGVEDGASESFTSEDGKLDGVSLSLAELGAVLSVINGAPLEVLTTEVGLSSRVAGNIAAHRAGSDAVLDTPDDDRFDSLMELDEVPHVGPLTLEALLDHARSHGLVGRPVPLSRNDVSVLFPLSANLLAAGDPGRGGPLLPRELFDQIGLSMFKEIEDTLEYDALLVVASRFDPCFVTALGGRCQAQVRLVVQAATSTTTSDGAIHLLYNLDDSEVESLTDDLRALRELAPQNLLGAPLGLSPALSAQGLAGPYALELMALIQRTAGSANLARMTFMTRTDARQGQWQFGGFHLQARPETGFPAPGDIAIVGSDATLQTVSNNAFGLTFNYDLDPEFSDVAGRGGTSSSDLTGLGAAGRQKIYDWAIRQEQPQTHVPDTTDCAACHVSGRIALALEQLDPALVTPAIEGARGQRIIGATEPLADNLRAFGYFDASPHASQRTANETEAALAGFSVVP